MCSAASSRLMSSRWASPNASIPYSSPKLMTFARRRISGLTSPGSTPNTLAEVAVWMSWPDRNASTRPSSPDR